MRRAFGGDAWGRNACALSECTCALSDAPEASLLSPKRRNCACWGGEGAATYGFKRRCGEAPAGACAHSGSRPLVTSLRAPVTSRLTGSRASASLVVTAPS
eukprot:3189076-Rhodomonas_salina.1